jgi:hypothetical protein
MNPKVSPDIKFKKFENKALISGGKHASALGAYLALVYFE